ncbi:MAG: threonine ammonia-lyase, partial [Spirochaetales bacterium]|nr:threonine ammonia-lyase [Spirochaetales bacterium]
WKCLKHRVTIHRRGTNMNVSDIEKAALLLKGIISETKLIHSPIFSAESGSQVYLKPENLQLTGAFKLRGAYYKIACLSKEERQKGLIASSAGNHAQGVALAARLQGAPATIVMPRSTPLIKVKATESYGARVILHGDVYDDAYGEAKRRELEEDLVFIHPFNDEEIMAGQGTIGLEILEEMNDVDAVILPIGGGGLIAGVATAIKARRPEVEVIGVEPEGAAAMKQSLEAGRLLSLDRMDTIAEGVAVKSPGAACFQIIREKVDRIVTVPDNLLMEAFLLLLERHKIVAENSGLLSLAALQKLDLKGKKVVSLISGGNIDVVTMSSLIDNGLVRRGRICCFSLNLPDKPGQLLAVSQILARENANIIKLEHNQFKSLDRLQDVELEVTVETNGHDHIRSLLSALEKEGYRAKRVY